VRLRVEQCETLRDRFAVLDAPPQRSRSAVEAGAVAREWRKRFETQFAALYLPWLRARDPGGAPGLRELPPCGHVCGLYARFDLAGGVHFPPANGDLRWVHDVVARIDDGLHGVLNQEGIDAIRVFPGKGVLVYGARTMSSDPLWRFVNVRRLLSMIEKALQQACQWAVFEPHTLQLRSLMRLNIVSFLEAIWEAGGLVGGTPDEAFRVLCDQTNNPAAAVDAGELVTDVLVAPVVPGEFIVLRVGRVDGQIEIAELGRGGVLANVAAA
jgi:Bacteriophage tail sheath protein